MIKKFHIRMPLSLKDSFDLLYKSGKDIMSWQIMDSDFEHGVIVWKQTFWSLTGKAGIMAKLAKINEKETSVEIEVHKPLQIFDPAKICEKVFRKLDRAWKKNLNNYENHE